MSDGVVHFAALMLDANMQRIITILMLVSFAIMCSHGAGEEPTHAVDGRKAAIPARDTENRRVIVEGLAWGSLEKGLGQRIQLADGHRVYIRNIDYQKHDLDGKLVRAAGMLRRETMKAAPQGAQGYTSDFDYFTLTVEKWGVIERVKKPWTEEFEAEQPKGR